MVDQEPRNRMIEMSAPRSPARRVRVLWLDRVLVALLLLGALWILLAHFDERPPAPLIIGPDGDYYAQP